MNEKFRKFKITSLTQLPQKFKYAWEGLVAVLKYELSFRIELVISTGVVIAGYVMKLGRLEWMFLILAIAAIFTAEFLNTAIEKTVDHLHPEIHPEIKAIKDISAAGVMIANIAGIIIVLFLFGPRIAQLAN